MADNPIISPELASVLATLARFATPAATSLPSDQISASEDAARSVYSRYENGFGDSANVQHVLQEQTADPRLRPQHRSTPISRSSTPLAKAVIDPATITDWREGLRCVTKIAAQNANFSATIKRVRDRDYAHTDSCEHADKLSS